MVVITLSHISYCCSNITDSRTSYLKLYATCNLRSEVIFHQKRTSQVPLAALVSVVLFREVSVLRGRGGGGGEGGLVSDRITAGFHLLEASVKQELSARIIMVQCTLNKDDNKDF